MDGKVGIYNARSGEVMYEFEGHTQEVSKVCFNPQGTRVLSASADSTARIWDLQRGICEQTLEGHTDEIFGCAFNYEGDMIVTGLFSWIDFLSWITRSLIALVVKRTASKDITCRIWVEASHNQHT